MSLKARITEDMKAALRAREADRLGTIRLLLAALKQREVDERIELDDAAVVAVVDKLIKQRKDSVAQYSAAGRQDLADREQAEIAVLAGYLPARLDAAEVQARVDALGDALAAELGRPLATGDMGKLMGSAKAALARIAEMAQVSAAVKARLSR